MCGRIRALPGFEEQERWAKYDGLVCAPGQGGSGIRRYLPNISPHVARLSVAMKDMYHQNHIVDVRVCKMPEYHPSTRIYHPTNQAQGIDTLGLR